jgi:hypothetical protein
LSPHFNFYYSSSLYGFNRENQESVRQMKQGLLKPDQWYDKRLVIQPAGKLKKKRVQNTYKY